MVEVSLIEKVGKKELIWALSGFQWEEKRERLPPIELDELLLIDTQYVPLGMEYLEERLGASDLIVIVVNLTEKDDDLK